MLTQMIQLMYLIYFRPFEEPEMFRIEVFNEIITLLLLYALSCFSDANGHWDNEEQGYVISEQATFDISFITIVCLSLSVHISLLMTSSIKDLIKKIKAKCCKQKKADLTTNVAKEK